ncbi:MAG: tRNA 2-thiouridine(34) synthase MnmA [Pseudomonadota bacterium]
MRAGNKKRVVVSMSGGVDSSVAAGLLKNRGYDVIGVSMQIWDYSTHTNGEVGSCCSPDDIYHARAVADKLNIPFYVLNLENEFEKEVIDYFVSEYMRGRTPNPCILCNQKVKFEVLLRKALELQADCLATGHHARIVWDDSRQRYLLLKGVDSGKDQSYFLFTLRQEELKRLVFPIGDLVKADVRKIASDLGLRVADKKESQEICFIPDNDYKRFIATRIGIDKSKKGNIANEEGEILGTHEGIHMFTIGQRRGLGIPASQPYYVIGFDLQNNSVIVGRDRDLLAKGLIAENLNWISLSDLNSEITASCKIRYRYKEAEATVIPRDDGQVLVRFSTPQKAITPGQAVVFYDGDVVVGGGWIKESI